MEIMVDASIITEVILEQDKAEIVRMVIKNRSLVSSAVLPFEVGNSLSNKMIRNIINTEQALDAYGIFKLYPVTLRKIDMNRAVKIAGHYLCFAYDAYYLEVASRLNLPLFTFDKKMKKNGKDMGITIVEAQDEFRN
jgi:predicted nucleic acid-binding protein